MSIEQAKVLIELLPTIVIYIIPGYLIIWVISFILSFRIEKDSNLFLKSIVLSYLVITFGNLIAGFWGLNILLSNYLKVTIIFLSIFIGYGISLLIQQPFFNRIMNKIGINKTVYTSIWNDIIDTKKVLVALVYLGDEKKIYKGQIRKFDENDDGDNTYLLLSNYVIYKYETGDEVINYEKNNENRVLLNTKDISRIELFYHPDSHKIQ